MVVKGDDRISKQANEDATTLMKCLVRSMLCSRQVIEKHRLTAEAFDWLVGEIETRFQRLTFILERWWEPWLLSPSEKSLPHR